MRAPPTREVGATSSPISSRASKKASAPSGTMTASAQPSMSPAEKIPMSLTFPGSRSTTRGIMPTKKAPRNITAQLKSRNESASASSNRRRPRCDMIPRPCARVWRWLSRST